MKLPYDVPRCLGAHCDVKHECERYLQRHEGGERTPMYNNACHCGEDAFIPIERADDLSGVE